MGDLSFFRGLLGGGGFVTDIDMSSDGTLRLIRTDVHQCYKFNSTSGLWEGLITPTSMPVGERFLGNNGEAYNCYAIRHAPSNPDIIYAVFPGTTTMATSTRVYKSTDRGATWVKQTGMTPMLMTVNNGGRFRGQKMAVHPTDPNICLVGNTAGEIWRTANGGTSWTKITTPTGNDPSIVFDPTDGNKVYIGWSSGTSRVYRSTDAGATFAQMTGGPNTINRSTAAIDGTIYIVSADAGNQNAWKLSGTTFTNLSPTWSGGFWCVACDPTNVNRVTLGTPGGNINTSLNAGSTWSGTYPDAAIRVATDVPWLAWTNEDFMTSGNIAYDPVVAGRLWFVQGIGIWYTDSVPTGATIPTWTSKTAGNDELIVDDAIWPPGGKFIFSVQDRGVFRISDYTNYPSTHGTRNDVNLQHGWGVDYASSDPNFIALVMSAASAPSYSTDGGVTWTAFADLTPQDVPGGIGGSIAALTPTSMVWFGSNNARPYYTTNGGTSWALCTFPGDVPTSGITGWGNSIYDNIRCCAADRVDSTFYAFNAHTGTGDFYKSVDGGANFTKTADAVTLGFVGASYRVQTVPGKAGHIFLTGGTVNPNDPHPYNISMKRSTDAGSTWSSVANTQEVWALGFGKEAPGSSYPTIMIAGYANGDALPGIYTSIDNCVTWVLQSNYPDNSMDLPRAIAGDLNTYGSFGIGLSATGFVYSRQASITGKSFGLQF